jgi:3'-5' exonuclease
LDQLTTHIEAVTKSASANDKKVIFLDCEGRDLGKSGGKLGLVQLGIESEIYLVDVIAFPKTINVVKDILENPVLEKVVWDGRSDYAELWHGHGIDLNPVLDLQLVHVYKFSGGLPGPRGFIALTGMSTAFSRLNSRERSTCVDADRMTRGPPHCSAGS